MYGTRVQRIQKLAKFKIDPGQIDPGHKLWSLCISAMPYRLVAPGNDLRMARTLQEFFYKKKRRY